MIRISEQQVRESIRMPQAIELVEQMLLRLCDGRAVNHPRHRVVMQNGTLLHYMAGGNNESGLVGIKIYASNPALGAPNFVVLLFDAHSAKLLASIDANSLGQIRTGAASGVATRCLARPDACRLALFGSGFQAETQLEAVACVRNLKSVRVYSRRPEKREAFARRMSTRLNLPVRTADSPKEALQGADMVTTITTARSPVFSGAHLLPGTHINAAGSNHARRRELDAETLRRSALVVVDSLGQARMEAGDLMQASDDGVLDWNEVCELHEVLAGTCPGRSSDQQITLFESQGLAVEDIALAGFLYERLCQ